MCSECFLSPRFQFEHLNYKFLLQLVESRVDSQQPAAVHQNFVQRNAARLPSAPLRLRLSWRARFLLRSAQRYYTVPGFAY